MIFDLNFFVFLIFVWYVSNWLICIKGIVVIWWFYDKDIMVYYRDLDIIRN